MWDGFWFLANRRAWAALPADVQAIVAKHINAAAVNERADVAKLNAGLQQDLAAKGLVFNQPATAPFRDKLEIRRLLRRVERQIWRGGVGSPGEGRRQADLS